MTDQDRLAQLRALLNRLERMPASPDRDHMLAEVRSRAVDLDTGIAPRPMRPLESASMTLEPEAVAPKPAAKTAPPAPVPARTPAKPAVRRVAPPRAAAPVVRREPVAEPPAWEATFPASKAAEVRVDLLSLGGLLSLDDEVPATVPVEGERPANRPWAGGLRG
jgi:hypothetical protein